MRRVTRTWGVKESYTVHNILHVENNYPRAWDYFDWLKDSLKGKGLPVGLVLEEDTWEDWGRVSVTFQEGYKPNRKELDTLFIITLPYVINNPYAWISIRYRKWLREAGLSYMLTVYDNPGLRRLWRNGQPYSFEGEVVEALTPELLKEAKKVKSWGPNGVTKHFRYEEYYTEVGHQVIEVYLNGEWKLLHDSIWY